MRKLLPQIFILVFCTGLFSCKKENVSIENSSTQVKSSATSSGNNGAVSNNGSNQRGNVGGSSAGSGYPESQGNIVSNFNGTPIPAGRTVWFNAHLKPSNTQSNNNNVTIYVNNATINFSSNGTDYIIPVPNAEINYSNAFSTASYTFDASNNKWYINVPANYIKDVFLGGVAMPSAGLAGGINPVTFSASFSSNKPNLSFDWQWSAAVYTNFSSDYGSLQVLPVDTNGKSVGSPMQFQGYAVGGARGGGAANMTGSWSSTGHMQLD